MTLNEKNAVVKSEGRKIDWARLAPKLLNMAMLAMMVMAVVGNFAYADGLTSAIDALQKVILRVLKVAGGLFLIGGLVSYLINFSDDGPSKKNAVMFMAVGGGLFVASTVLEGVNMSSWIN